MRLLGIDYGRKHTGIAVATSPLSEPVETVLTDRVIKTIQQLIANYALKAIVLGVSEGAMAEEIRTFAKKLQLHIDIPIFLHDETLSSHQTRKRMAKAGLKKSRREAKIDHLVAATILQDFIDTYDTLDQVPETARIS